jgi:hypothetical protein
LLLHTAATRYPRRSAQSHAPKAAKNAAGTTLAQIGRHHQHLLGAERYALRSARDVKALVPKAFIILKPGLKPSRELALEPLSPRT